MNSAIAELLTPEEVERFRACEAAIERSYKVWREAAAAWREIRDSRLYRRSAPTFEAYCELNGTSKTHVNRLIRAAEVSEGLEMAPAGAIELGERHFRELARLPEECRSDALKEAIDESAGKPTAEKIREVGARYAPFKATATKPAQSPAKPAAVPQRAAETEEPWSPPQPGDDDGQFSDDGDADALFDGEPEDEDDGPADYRPEWSRWLSEGERLIDETVKCNGEASVPLDLFRNGIAGFRRVMGGQA